MAYKNFFKLNLNMMSFLKKIQNAYYLFCQYISTKDISDFSYNYK